MDAGVHLVRAVGLAALFTAAANALALCTAWFGALGSWETRLPGPVTAGRLLLVTAHPDDECMYDDGFFGPFVQRTVVQGHTVFILCLSNGGAGGMGRAREKELEGAAERLGLPRSHVRVIDDPSLPDGMQTVWEEARVLRYVEGEVASRGVDHIVTFDRGGVSGHANHRAAHAGVRAYARKVWQLATVGLAQKYSGALGALLSAALCPRGWACYLAHAPGGVLDAMRRHTSQMVWFRWAYVLFSRYMFASTLAPLHPP